MAKAKPLWKKGRGKLGIMDPLIGRWTARSESPMGPVKCSREFARVLGGHYVQLIAKWEFGKGIYEEHALIGANLETTLAFWSFTSDGKRSQGVLSDVTDIHPEAIGFEAEMPAGLARTAYWPDDSGGFRWAVEARNKSGWKRFTEHHYRPASLAD